MAARGRRRVRFARTPLVRCLIGISGWQRVRTALAAFSWTYEKLANRYLPIRRRVSGDEGRTWRMDVPVFADQPSRPAVFGDGRAVMAWVDRYGTQSIRARRAPSLDGAFEQSSQVVLYEAAQEPRRTANTASLLTDMGLWTFGLPFGEALPDGNVLIVYYAGVETCMDVRWAKLTMTS
jgi:hypothetical protein